MKSFQTLTPTNTVDLGIYEDALDFAFSSDDICNVAVSGPYSSGKTSLLESYHCKHREYSLINISLAHFSDDHNYSVRNSEDIERQIEGKILNQLVQQVPRKKIPFTRFRIKIESGRQKSIIISLLTIFFLLAILHSIAFEKWCRFVADSGMSGIKYLEYTTSPWARLITSLLVVGFIACLFAYIVYLQANFKLIKGISFKGSEIELFPDAEMSLFDKHLDEILYIIDHSNADALIFEDLDRFNDLMIFEQIREINTILNLRFNESERKPIKFFYMLRDDVFIYKDRTKFFDFIIPVVPVVDSSNSFNVLKEYLEATQKYDQIDEYFLRSVSLYIDDIRVIKNIINEYIIYESRLGGIEINSNHLFAMIVYKNIFPKDFSMLQLDRGYVFDLFENKEFLKRLLCKTYDKEKEELIHKIERCNNEVLISNSELEYVKSGYDANRFTDDGGHVLKLSKDELNRRKKDIEDKQAGNIDKYKERIAQIDSAVDNVDRQKLSSLIQMVDKNIAQQFFNLDESCGFVRNVKMETETDTDAYKSITTSHYYDLLLFLIKNGFIEESYSDNISYFYPNNLTVHDKNFMRGITDHNPKPVDYHIDNPRVVFENTPPMMFLEVEALNYDLTEYILIHKRKDCIKNQCVCIRDSRSFRYISNYISCKNNGCDLIREVCKCWPEVFSLASEVGVLTHEELERMAFHIVNSCDERIVNDVNIDECLTSFISSDNKFLVFDNYDSIKITKNLNSIIVKFIDIDYESSNQELFDSIYENNLYVINLNNILLMLKTECGFDEPIMPALSSLISYVFNHQDVPLCNYLKDNLQDFLTIVFDNCEIISDDSDTIISVLNHDNVSAEMKQEYISLQDKKIPDISKIQDVKLWSELLEYESVEYSVDNVLAYYNQFGIDSELIGFINADDRDLNYIGYDSDLRNRFLDQILAEDKVDDDKYFQIANNCFESIDANTVKGVSANKLLGLINFGLIEFNKSNLDCIRNMQDDILYEFIHKFKEEYISMSDFSDHEIAEIISWDDVAIEKRLKILSSTSNPISLIDRQYDDKVIIHILRNNLIIKEIEYLSKHYSNYSESVRTVILEVMNDKLSLLTSDNDELDHLLICDIFEKRIGTIEDRFTILAKYAASLNIDELESVLKKMGAAKIADNLFNNSRVKVEVTEHNTRILKSLTLSGLINMPEVGKDGKHYKKVKYKRNKFISNSR